MTDRDGILNAARKLAETLKESVIYNEYHAALLKVRGQPQLFSKLKEFKQTRAEIESKSAPGSPISIEDEKIISHRYAELANDPGAAEFLTGEKAMLEAYVNVLDIIDEALDIELF